MKTMKLVQAGTAAAAFCGLTGWASAGLVGSWSFEDGPGNTTADSVSSTASDTFGSGVAFSSDTVAPGSTASLSIGGSSDLETNLTGADLGITGTGAKTFAAWIKMDSSVSGRQGIVSYSPTNGTGSGEDLRLVYDASAGQLRLEVSAGAAGNDDFNLADGQWHLVAAIIPANSQAQDIDFYIDGDIYDDEVNSTRAINTATGLSEFFIGNDQTSNEPTGIFDGLIDDVKVYDHALTESELDALLVPEPASLALLTLGGLAMIRRR